MKYSQRYARKLEKRVQVLESILRRERRVWSQDWIGAEIARLKYTNADDMVPTAVRVARRLGHAVVVVGQDDGVLRFVALPFEEAKI